MKFVNRNGKCAAAPATVVEPIESLEPRQLLSASSTTALVSSLSKPVVGQSVTLTATVKSGSASPTGTVTFKSGSLTLGTASVGSSHTAALSTTKLPVGTDSVTASYGGASSFGASSSSAVVETVGKASTSTALKAAIGSSVYEQGVLYTATVTAKSPGGGVPGGTVTFAAGGVSFGTATLNSSGVATLTRTYQAPGSVTVTATYGGSSSYGSSASSSLSHTVAKAGTTAAVSVSSSSTLLGQSATFTASVKSVSPGAGTPAGTVSFYDGSTVLGTATLGSSGTAELTETQLFAGTHAVTVKYAGNTDYAASTSGSTKLTVALPTFATASDGLGTATVKAGSGRGAVDGDTLRVNYTGYLTNGTIFDSSLNAGRTPFDFELGAGQVIAGWDQGLVGLKVGETRVLRIPPSLGYGSTAQGPIPANSTLIFVVNLVQFDVPKLAITGKGAAVNYDGTPTSSNGTLFGTTKVGSSSAVSTFVIEDTGEASLEFTAASPVTISGANAGDFVVTQPTIANNLATFTVTFKPTAKGSRSAVVTVLTNDPTHPSFTFTVTGTGD